MKHKPWIKIFAQTFMCMNTNNLEDSFFALDQHRTATKPNTSSHSIVDDIFVEQSIVESSIILVSHCEDFMKILFKGVLFAGVSNDLHSVVDFFFRNLSNFEEWLEIHLFICDEEGKFWDAGFIILTFLDDATFDIFFGDSIFGNIWVYITLPEGGNKENLICVYFSFLGVDVVGAGDDHLVGDGESSSITNDG